MELDMSIQNKLQDGYDALLLSYASGTLDEAQSLAVATHLTFSQTASNFVQNCEAIGGALIESEYCGASMNKDSLDNVLDRLEDRISAPSPQKCTNKSHNDIGCTVPTPLKAPLNQQDTLSWKTVLKGFHSCDIDLNCKQSKARLIKLDPAIKSPHHSHSGTEITLVLDGAFSDETGSYEIGDLIVTDESFSHAPVACKFHGCTCLVVSTAPIKLTGVAGLLNPFLKP